ncbi:MAG TPA: adenylosuccinate lyase [Thermoplasmata archaeon]|nr:adenylosuccinate lyase [Thermoplasmata archaeon]
MSAPDSDAFCPLEYRYGRDEVRAIFSRRARLARALQIEATLARVEGDLGLIPAEGAEAIGRAASDGSVTLERVEALERELQHDVMAMTRALAERSGIGAGWVHFGATSNDVTDTALGLELKESARILDGDLRRLGRALLELAKTHRSTAEVGRTHGQHAVPLSFGYKMAVGAAEIQRHRRRLSEILPRLAVGKMSGAVGTGAGFGVQAADVEAKVLDRLGLTPDEAPTQIVGRDRLAEFMGFLALTASSCERLATELRNLQRSEIQEVQEPFDEARQVGSSTMAQKRNPMASENVTSLARLVRALAAPSLENMVQWHERDLSNSANERIALPHAVVLTDDLLQKLARVFEHLTVDPAQMARHLASSGGLLLTESLMLELTRRGLPRSEAHELLRTLTRGAGPSDAFAARARADPTILRFLRPDEVDRLLEPTEYVAAAAAKTDAIVRRLAPELER